MTFAGEHENGVAKYIDVDGETVMYLVQFHDGRCVELFDGELTGNRFTYD